MKSIFTIPKVVKYDDLGKSWFVYFRYDKKLFRYKYGINYINNYKEREKEANALRDALLLKLKEGWNPLIPEIEIENSKLTFIEALDFAIEKKTPNISKKTLSGYKGTINFIKTSTQEINLNNLFIVDTKRAHIKLIMEKAAYNRKWSNKAYNKHLNHLKAILSELIQWDIIEVNPAHNIKNLPVEDSRANIPATIEEHKKIKEFLSNNHPNFYTYIVSIFHTGIRPEELLNIKLNMIDLKMQQVILPSNSTKTNKERIVPINNHLLKMLLDLNLDAYPEDYYLFGSFREPGKGNIGKHIDFIPGPTQIKRDTATKRWKKIIKDNLGIQVNMYSNKHAGANAKILAGMDLDALRELYGHTSKLMTVRYAKVVKEVYRKQILENSPDF